MSFDSVQDLRPRRSSFNLSHTKCFDCDMGQLVPVLVQECIPGDSFTIANEAVVRFQPMVAPMLTPVNIETRYFFVPDRLVFSLSDDGTTTGDQRQWTDFITGGVEGTADIPMPIVTNSDFATKYSLWDYFGLPLRTSDGQDVSSLKVSMLPFRAYQMIYNEFFRDENLQEPVKLSAPTIRNVAWKKDYFTSSLPWQQRGISPALPLSGNASVNITSLTFPAGSNLGILNSGLKLVKHSYNSLGDDKSDGTAYGYVLSSNDSNVHGSGVSVPVSGEGTADVSQIATFDVSDLRLAFQIQKWMERNARCGVRYVEFLRAHFGVAPHDETLQRPEYIGGSKSPLIVSEVLQTSASGENSTPQGTFTGHGISADHTYIGRYVAREFGWIIGVMYIRPEASYSQGIPRGFTRESRYDFYFPEFANLSEQAIAEKEIYGVPGTSPDVLNRIFGYQGRFDELRHAQSKFCGAMRDTLNYWHLGRTFSDAPNLNGDFITCNPSKRIFAVQNIPEVIVNFANIVKAVRPIPKDSNPGLIDHS